MTDDLLIRIGADLAKLKSDMDGAKRIVATASDAMKASAKIAGIALAGIGVAALAALLPIKKMVGSALEIADAASKMSSKIGVTTDEVGGLTLAFRQSGIDSKGMETSLVMLSRAAVEGKNGFNALGISTRDASGNVKGTKQLLYEVADAFKGAEKSATKTAIATELFSRAGAAMIPLLNGGSEALRDMDEKARALGLSISAETGVAAEHFNDTLDLVGQGMVGVSMRVTAQLLPTLNALVDSFLMTVTEGDRLTRMADGIASVFQVVYTVVLGGVEVFNTLGRIIAGTVAAGLAELGALADAVVKIFAGDFSGALESARQGFQLSQKISAEATKDIADGWTATGKAISRAWDTSAESTVGAVAAQQAALKNLHVASKEEEDAAKAAAAAEKKRAEEIRKATEEGIKAVRAIMARVNALKMEIDIGRNLTNGEKENIKLTEDLVEGKIRLTKGQESAARAMNLLGDALTAERDLNIAAQKANLAHAEAMDGTVVKAQDEAKALRLANAEYGKSAEQLANLRAAKLLDAAASADRLAIQAKDIDFTGQLTAQYEALAAAYRDSASQVQQGAHLEAAKAAANEWQKVIDDVGKGLTDSLFRAFEAGRGFFSTLWDGIKNVFKTTVLKLIISPIQQASSNLLSSALGGGQSGGGLTQATSALGSFYSALSSASGLLGTAGTSIFGSSAAYGAAIGTTNIAAGSQAAMLASQTGTFGAAGATATSQAAAGAGAGAASYAAVAGYAALVAVAAYKASGDYSDGFTGKAGINSQDQVFGSGKYLAPEFGQYKLFSALGISDRIASLLSGATGFAKLFGRADPKIQESGIRGSFAGGNFTGNAYADIKEKGGIFRSDKRYTNTAELPDDIGRFLDVASKTVIDKTKDYAKVLGLPGDALASVTSEIKIKLIGDAAANNKELLDAIGSGDAQRLGKIKAKIAEEDATNTKALVEAIGGYGDALVKGFADSLSPLSAYGETTIQTLERVAGALVDVNAVLEELGLNALDATLAGAKAATGLADAFGGLDKLGAAAGVYYAAFYSDAEKLAAQQAKLAVEFARIGVSAPRTREQFRELVEAQDRTTEAGQRTFAALLNVAGAFDAVQPAAQSAVEAVVDTVNKIVESLTGFRASLADTIEATRLRTLSPQARIASLKDTEQKLFSQLQTSDDPAAVAGRLQDVLIARIKEQAALEAQAQQDGIAGIKEQAALEKQARAAQIEGLQAQINSARQLTTLAQSLRDFRAGLLSSDLSPLSFEKQLANSRQSYEDTLSRAYAGDTTAQAGVTGAAGDYLKQARAYYGSGGDYAAIFEKITGDLGQGAIDADRAGGQASLLQQQLDVLRATQEAAALNTQLTIDTSNQELAALQSLDAALAARLQAEATAAAERVENAKAQIIEQQATTSAVQAQTVTTQAGFIELRDQLATLNGQVGQLVHNADLQTAEP